jgi:hypothetical protein
MKMSLLFSVLSLDEEDINLMRRTPALKPLQLPILELSLDKENVIEIDNECSPSTHSSPVLHSTPTSYKSGPGIPHVLNHNSSASTSSFFRKSFEARSTQLLTSKKPMPSSNSSTFFYSPVARSTHETPHISSASSVIKNSIHSLRNEIERSLGMDLSSTEGMVYLLLSQQRQLATLIEEVKELRRSNIRQRNDLGAIDTSTFKFDPISSWELYLDTHKRLCNDKEFKSLLVSVGKVISFNQK